MGTYVYKLPDVGEGTAEAEIVAWHVRVGDTVEEDQNLVDVMTDKATVEMTAPVSGKVIALHGSPGDMAAVGAPLVEFEVSGQVGSEAVRSPKSDQPHAAPSGEQDAAARSAVGARPPAGRTALTPSQTQEVTAAPTHAAYATRSPGERPVASPAVRQRARDRGIELQFVPGTGTGGRITQGDLDAFLANGGRYAPASSHRQAREGIDDVKVIGLRRKIAEKMQDAKRRIPHFTYVDEVDMTELEALRAHLNATRHADQPKLTVLPFLVRALVKLLPDYPQINARFDDEAGVVHRYRPVHVGIATQTPNGLIVPVVRNAEALDLWQCAAEVARLASATRENKAKAEDVQGSTITITSLGVLGGLVTTPVINHPEVAIIAPNAIIERAVVRDGQVVVRKMMNLSASFDHRVVDGHDAAEFIHRIKDLLQHTALLFME